MTLGIFTREKLEKLIKKYERLILSIQKNI